MPARKSYIEIGWKLDKTGLTQAQRETDKLRNSERAISQAGVEANRQLQEGLQKTTNKTKKNTDAFSKMRHELDRNNSSIALTKKEHEAYSNRLKAEGRYTEAQKAKNNSLRTSYKSLNSQLSQENELLRKVAATSGRNSDAYKRQSIKVNELRTEIAKTKDKMLLMNDAGRRTSTSFNRLHRAGSGLVNMGNNIALAMLPVAAAFKRSADEATRLQNQYTTIKNLLNTGGESVGEARRNTNAMQRENNRFALQYGVSPVDMAKGGEELVRRGYSGKQELASHKSFLQAARASGDDYNSVVGYGAPVLEQFNFKNRAGNSVRKMRKYTNMVLNEMAYGADLTATDFTGIGNAMRYAGATAHSTNQRLPATIAALGVLSNNGQDGSVSGTGLRKVLNAFGSPKTTLKSQQGQAMKELGLEPEDFQTANGHIKSLADNMAVLQKATAGMSDGEKFNIFHKFFGTTGQESALILSKNVKQLRALTRQVGHAQKYGKHGYIATLAQKNMKSWQNQINVFKQYMNIMGLGFTKTVLPGFTSALHAANSFLGALIKLPPAVKNIIGPSVALLSIWGTVKAGKGLFSLLKGRGSLVSKVPEIAGTVGKGKTSFVGSLLSTKSTESASASSLGLLSKLGGSGKFGKLLSGAKAVGSKIPWLDVALAATSLIGINKHNAGGKIGNFGGTLAGMEGGAALGSFLGPLGTVIGGGLGAMGGGFLGSKAGKFVQKQTRTVFNARPSRDQQKKSGGHATHSTTVVTPMGVTQIGDDARNKVKRHKTSRANVNDVAHAWANNKNASTSVKFINRAAKLEQQANEQWALSAGQTSKKLKQTYSNLYKVATGYADKRLSSDKKNLSYLQKQGLLSNTTASKAYNAEKNSTQQRLASLKRSLNTLDNADKLSNKQRIKAISRVNQQILALTDNGAKKQTGILKALNARTTHLNLEQYSKIIINSKKAYKATVENAHKTYDNTVKNADKRYKTEVKAAKAIKGISASQRRTIIANAKKQHDNTIENAHTQYIDTVRWAKKQHTDVVNEAREQAGDVKNAFSGVFDDIVGPLNNLLNQNSFAGLTTRQHKFHSSDFTKNKAKHTGNNGLPNLGTRPMGNVKKKKPKRNAFGQIISYATGTKNYPNGLPKDTYSLVNDGNGPEAIILPGRNRHVVVPKGGHVLNAKDTEKAYGPQHFASGTTRLKIHHIKGQSNTYTYNIDNRSVKSAVKSTDKSMKKISQSIVGGYADSEKGSSKHLTKLRKGNLSTMKSLMADSKKYSQKTQANTVGDFSDMRIGANKQLSKMHADVVKGAKNITADYDSIMGHLDNYTHGDMADAIGQLNKGFTSVNTALSQFGGNKSVLKLAHYATGTNGPVEHDQLAVLNDAKSGPHEEGLLRGNTLTLIKGHDVVTPMRKGDQVLNGRDLRKAKEHLPHLAKGAGSKDALRKLADTNEEHPSHAFSKDFVSKIGNNLNARLSNGIAYLESIASKTTGVAWYQAMWNVIQNAIGAGAGRGGTREAFLKYAESHFAGKPYNMGSTGPTYYDCSGMVMAALRHFGIDIGRTTVAMQTSSGVESRGHDLKNTVPGDIVVFGHGGGAAGHVGIIKNPRTGSMFNETPPRARVTPISDDKGMGYEYFRIKGLHDAAKKSSKVDPKLRRLAKSQLGSKAYRWIQDNLSLDDDLGSIGGRPAGDYESLIRKAAKAMHATIPGGKWMSYMLKMIQNESGGRAGVTGINDGDGTGSAMGLLQFKKSTFDAYAVKGHKNILSAWDQLLAFFNNSHYRTDIGVGYNGKIGEWRGNTSGPSGHRRFANGGRVPSHEKVIVGEKGMELAEFEQPVRIYDHQKTVSKLNAAQDTKTKRGVNIHIDKIEIKANSVEEGRSGAKGFLDELQNIFNNELDNLELG